MRLERPDYSLNIPKYVAKIVDKNRDILAPVDAKALSFRSFAEKCYIRSGTSIVPFKLYWYQELLGEIIDKYPVTAIVKTRQLGITETVACRHLYRAATDNAFMSAFFSRNREDTQNVVKRIRLMIENYPDLDLNTDSTAKLQIRHGGMMVYLPTTDNAGRGLESLSEIALDEVAFPENAEALYSAVAPAMEMLGDEARKVLMSTPNGKSGFFWRMMSSDNGKYDLLEECEKAKEAKTQEEAFRWWVDEDGIAKVVIHWKAHPVYNSRQNYLVEVKKRNKLTNAAIQREFNLGWEESESSVYAWKDIERAVQTSWIEHEHSLGSDIQIWLPPMEGRHYVASLDPNSGGDDYYTFGIHDITDPIVKVCALFRKRKAGSSYCTEKSGVLIDLYQVKTLSGESNSMGVWALDDIGRSFQDLEVLPVFTSSTSKRKNTDRLALLLEAGEIHIPKGRTDSEELQAQEMKGCPISEELQNFRQDDKGRRSAAPGFHDDTVMMLAIMAATLDDVRSRTDDIQEHRSMLGLGIEDSSERLVNLLAFVSARIARSLPLGIVSKSDYYYHVRDFLLSEAEADPRVFSYIKDLDEYHKVGFL